MGSGISRPVITAASTPCALVSRGTSFMIAFSVDAVEERS